MSMAAIIPAWMCAFPASGKDPTWLSERRKHHHDAFLRTGLPTPKNDRWKYTDVSFLAARSYLPAPIIENEGWQSRVAAIREAQPMHVVLVMLNGRLVIDKQDYERLPEGVIVCDLSRAVRMYPELLQSVIDKEIDAAAYPFAVLNQAQGTDGVFVHVPKNSKTIPPLHMVSICSGEQAFILHQHHVVLVASNSELTLIEEYISLSDTAYVTTIVDHISLAEQATLQHIKLQQENEKATHIATCFVNQSKDSDFSFVTLSQGAAFARDDLHVSLTGQGATAKAYGYYHVSQDHQYIDHHLHIDHLAPHTQSEMLYKGIVDKRGKAVFNGKLFVAEHAQKIQAFQGNHHLLLSDQAEAYAKPELEIYADDVKCKHGATTGQLDLDALFYLRSRGIAEADATAMLLAGFADAVLEKISSKDIKQYVTQQFALGCTHD